ncbi:hypothetical protein WDW37_20465 [Bdellovibrionota bacterium FG-1]
MITEKQGHFNQDLYRQDLYRKMGFVAVLTLIGGLAFAAGLAYSKSARAAGEGGVKTPRVIYPKHTDLDFEGLKLQGEVRSPGEFYFQHRNEEKFDSLVKRRKNFHQEMLRDVVLSK